MINDAVPLLHDETDELVPDYHRKRRLELLTSMRDIPNEAITRLRFLKPQAGCFNRCTFCSQRANPSVIQTTRDGMRDIVAALAATARERGVNVAQGHGFRPGVLSPYVDNDIGSFPYLADFLRIAHEDLKCSVRLSTVGYSSRNSHLNALHADIASNLTDAIEGLRLSLTPYTFGWTTHAQSSGNASRTQYIDDIATVLRTYEPFMRSRGTGRFGISVEFRFAPHVEVCDVVEGLVAGRHAIAAGPHTLVSIDHVDAFPEPVKVLSLCEPVADDDDPLPAAPRFSASGIAYLLSSADAARPLSLENRVRRVLDRQSSRMRRLVQVHASENHDGRYFAVDPAFTPDGMFRALHIYPTTATRRAGYNDASRHFLNTLLEYKTSIGVRRLECFPGATWHDVAHVIEALELRSATLQAYDSRAAIHVADNVLPLVRDFVAMLQRSSLPPSLFFDPAFAIDTGQIANEGRARHLLHGLVSCEDTPFTPWEERQNLYYGGKGYVWALETMAFNQSPEAGQAPELVQLHLRELDARHYSTGDYVTGRKLRSFVIGNADFEFRHVAEAREAMLYPGAI